MIRIIRKYILEKCFITVLLSTLFNLSTFSFAQIDYGCKKKEDNLKIQLIYAEQHGNIQRAENLKRAIINVHEHCGDSFYNEDQKLQLDNDIYQQNLNTKIEKQQAKIASAERELEQAKLSGKEKKIREKTTKVLDRQRKLDDYQQELKSLLAQ